MPLQNVGKVHAVSFFVLPLVGTSDLLAQLRKCLLDTKEQWCIYPGYYILKLIYAVSFAQADDLGQVSIFKLYRKTGSRRENSNLKLRMRDIADNAHLTLFWRKIRPSMRYITFDNEHRQRHFDFFLAMQQPHTGITANVDITTFSKLIRKSAHWRFSPAIIYLLSRVAHEIPVFRQRIRKGQVVEHDRVDPSFSVPTKASSVFSFCTVEYNEDPVVFQQQAIEQIEKMQEDPSFEDEPGRDDYLFLSAMPWVSFTSLKHAMPVPADSVPRISWGKYFDQGDRVMMPLAVQAHHALVDGSDLGAYYQRLQRYLNDPMEVFGELT